MNPKLYVEPDGSKRWWLGGNLHRADGPAFEHYDGSKYWYINGKLHRVDGPAIERSSGGREWWINGRLHRIDGPAVIGASGYVAWWRNGKFHCESGPAIEYSNGDKEWWLNGECFDGVEFLIDSFITEDPFFGFEEHPTDVNAFLYNWEALQLTWLPEVLVIDGVEFVRDHKEC